MKTLFSLLLGVVLMGYYLDSAPSKAVAAQLHYMRSVHPHDYYSIVFKDTISTATIQKLAGETIQKYPQYDSVIINRFFPLPSADMKDSCGDLFPKQIYTVVNDTGTVIFIFHFFSRHMVLDDKRNVVCIYDSTNQNVFHLGEWVH